MNRLLSCRKFANRYLFIKILNFHKEIEYETDLIIVNDY